MAENNNNDPGLDKWIKDRNKKKNNSKKKSPKKNLDIKALENWLWEAACKIRGPIDAPKYKDYILPLIFIKRLSDVFEDELEKLIEEYGSLEIVEQLLMEDHSLVRFYLPKETRWEDISTKSTNIGEFLTDCILAIAKENPKLLGVIDIVDFNATAAGQRIISDDKLRLLINILGRYRLGLNDVEPDIFGRAYEYLLRKFAEGSMQSAGEFYTPREVAILVSLLINPKPGEEIYDPCCGSGGLLIKTYLRFKEKYKDDSSINPNAFYGQEISPTTFALAKMNSFIHDMEAQIEFGDTMVRPIFSNPNGSLKQFDSIVANPMWNQDFSQDIYENDSYNRFNFGYPPNSSADWGWIQHMYSSLKEEGKMAIILDTGAASRGSNIKGNNREKIIRKRIIEKDLIEAIILLPENLFYNATAAGIIMIINKSKKNKNQILVINAFNHYKKGTPKNFLPIKMVLELSDIYLNWKEIQKISKIITKADVVNNDYDLSPSRYVSPFEEEDILPLEDAVILFSEAEEERTEADEDFFSVMKKLGFKL